MKQCEYCRKKQRENNLEVWRPSVSLTNAVFMETYIYTRYISGEVDS